MSFSVTCVACEFEGIIKELDEVLQLQEDHQEIRGGGHLFEFEQLQHNTA